MRPFRTLPPDRIQALMFRMADRLPAIQQERGLNRDARLDDKAGEGLYRKPKTPSVSDARLVSTRRAAP